MKRFPAILLFAVIIISPVFAEENSVENSQDSLSRDTNTRFAVTLDPVPLGMGLIFGGHGIGVGVEYAAYKNYSVKANFSYTHIDFAEIPSFDKDTAKSGRGGPGYPKPGTDTTVTWFQMSLEGRWYPWGNNINGFFVNAGYQFHRFLTTADGVLTFYDTDKTIPLGPEPFPHPPRMAMADADTHNIYGGAGYKFIFGQSRFAPLLEVKLDYTLPLYTEIQFSRMDDSTSMLVGWFLGVKLARLGVLFGVTFE